MNRLQRYKESLQRFIKEKSCLYINNNIADDDEINVNIACKNCNSCDSCKNCKNCKLIKTSLLCNNCSECKNCFSCDTCNKDINSYIFSLIQSNDSIYSTLFLTVMNNQNKKNHMSLQGYYVATCIEFMDILVYIGENREHIISMFGVNKYIKMSNNLFIYAHKSLQQNIDSVKSIFTLQNLDKIIINSNMLLYETFKNIVSLFDHKFDVTNNNCNYNIIDWYLKNNNNLIKKFKSLNQVTKISLDSYINKKYFYMSELSILLGWMFGNGSVVDMDIFKQTIKYFSVMYKISNDFENLDKNIEESVIYSYNYVLNYGLQSGYEEFINNKQLFISDMLTNDVYSNTLKEIIDKIELDIDTIIDQTSPDLKSNYSTDYTGRK
jgi:hypothetical protein